MLKVLFGGAQRSPGCHPGWSPCTASGSSAAWPEPPGAQPSATTPWSALFHTHHELLVLRVTCLYHRSRRPWLMSACDWWAAGHGGSSAWQTSPAAGPPGSWQPRSHSASSPAALPQHRHLQPPPPRPPPGMPPPGPPPQRPWRPPGQQFARGSGMSARGGRFAAEGGPRPGRGRGGRCTSTWHLLETSEDLYLLSALASHHLPLPQATFSGWRRQWQLPHSSLRAFHAGGSMAAADASSICLSLSTSKLQPLMCQ